VERHAFALDQFAALDLRAPGSAAEMITNEIAPTALRGAQPTRRNENPGYNLEVVLPRLV